MQLANDRLACLLPEWHLLLKAWSADGRITAAAQEALLLNGEPQALTDLTKQWAAGEFGGLPPIVLLSSPDINGALGAYALSTGTIYLNADWLAGASKEQVFAVLTEELGHHLDGLLNAVDTPGDEGEYFYRLLSRKSLSDAQKASLRLQRDSTTINTGNHALAAEGAFVSQSNIKANGAASINTTNTTNKIQLLTIDNGLGSAWWSTAVDLSKDWSSSFNVTTSNGNGASDGFTFTINGDSRGVNAIGDGGQNLGFFGYDSKIGISNSYAVIFDMWTTQPANLIGFAPSNTSIIPQGNIVAPVSLANNAYGAAVYYSAALKSLSLTIGGQTFSQNIDLGSTVGNKAYLGFTAANGGGTMDTDISNWDVTASAYKLAPAIRGNSVYSIVDGPSWTEAEANAVALGGHLVTISDGSENSYLVQKYASPPFTQADIDNWVPGGRFDIQFWIGLTDSETEGEWRWMSRENSTFRNWGPGEPDENPTAPISGGEDYAIFLLYQNNFRSPGQWADVSDVTSGSGLAEIPIISSITRTGAVKEGAGVFTTSINLSAGTQTSGNLAEGAQVWWNITGITADDLATGALTGNGFITNGKLDIQHSLKIDGDSGEKFALSVYSDAAMSQQIGTTNLAAVQETSPIIRGNSFYTIVNGLAWTQAEANAVALGGHLTRIDDSNENSFIISSDLANTEPSWGSWIGASDRAQEGIWVDPSGVRLTYLNWYGDEPNNLTWYDANGEDYAAIVLEGNNPNRGTWADIGNVHPSGGVETGIAEIPIISSITRTGAVKEGAGVFTTSINLSAGTQTSGNLAEGAQVWWRISGITAEDLASGALSGEGIITNGKLDIQHSLAIDADTGENFEVSVYSDALMTSEYQIGSTQSAAITEKVTVRGNSFYTIVDGSTWTQAGANAVALGGNPGLIQSPSQATLPGLSAWVEVGGIAPSLCLKPPPPQPIST